MGKVFVIVNCSASTQFLRPHADLGINGGVFLPNYISINHFPPVVNYSSSQLSLLSVP